MNYNDDIIARIIVFISEDLKIISRFSSSFFLQVLMDAVVLESKYFTMIKTASILWLIVTL